MPFLQVMLRVHGVIIQVLVTMLQHIYHSVEISTNLVHPISALNVTLASVQRTISQNDDEVARISDALQQVDVKLAGLQGVNVEEDVQSTQLKVNLD